MSPPVLEARGLRHGFGPGMPFLVDLSLSFAEGEFAILGGRNGAGKTVLAKCLAGIHSTKPGMVRYRGESLLSLKGSPATRVAYLFQDARLQVLGDSVLEDARFGPLALGLPAEEADRRARAALEEVGLGGREGELPLGLSGGELRRLAIASVLALEPEVLILDEPFANLDWEGVSSLLAVIARLRAEGKTLILLTHELEKVLGLADRLLLMDRGEIVADGSPRELVGPLLERHGLRNPLRPQTSLADLQWTEAPEV